MAADLNKRDWHKLRNLMGRVHNVHVKRALKNSRSKLDKTNKQNSRLLEACLIDANDSIPEALFKSLFFWLDLGHISDRVEATATMPEWWPKRVGANHSQLVVTWRPTGKKSSYQVTIPHYNGDRNPKIPAYRKGSYRGELVCTDNSKLVVNAATELEAARVIRVLQRYIEPRFRVGRIAKVVKVRGAGFKEARVVPVLADYYPHGQADEGKRSWRKYF